MPGFKIPSSKLTNLPIFFIVGRGRSGSTLLRSVFDAHSQVMIPLESRFVQFLYYRYGSVQVWNIDLAKEALNELENGFEPLELDKEGLFKQITKEGDKLSFKGFCKLIYLHTKSEYTKQNVLLIGDKNPRYSFFTPQLKSIFPEAKFVHLVRDYRANIVTIKRAGARIQENTFLPVIVGRWKLYNRSIEKAKQKFPDQFYTIRFEDLVSEPELQVKDLCKFLSLKFEPAVLNYHEKIQGYYKNKEFEGLHKSLATPFDKTKINEWKTSLTTKEKLIAQILAGSDPNKYGYTPSEKCSSLRYYLTNLIYAPVLFAGQIRFYLKALLYRMSWLMRLAYTVILKMK